MILPPIEGKKVMFFHLPKTGGQSIYDAFGSFPQTHTTLQHSARQQELKEVSFAFAFVRHPLDRYVSFFHWVATLHKEFAKGRRAEHIGLNILARTENVNDFYRKFDFQYWDKVSLMLKPQAWMMWDGAKRIDPRMKIYRFEEFDKEFTRLCNDLNIPESRHPKLRHLNGTGGRGWESELEDDVVEKLCIRNKIDFDQLPFYENPLA
jgi:hypothetical protein